MTLREYQRVAKSFALNEKRMDSVDSILNTENSSPMNNSSPKNRVGTSFGATVLVNDSREGGGSPKVEEIDFRKYGKIRYKMEYDQLADDEVVMDTASLD